MNIEMPRMDGLLATRIIRKSHDKIKLPIIALTAHRNQFHFQAIEAGCNDSIDKPIDFDLFKSIIKQYLGY